MVAMNYILALEVLSKSTISLYIVLVLALAKLNKTVTNKVSHFLLHPPKLR